MAAGLVKGEGFAVNASVMEANASRYHGQAPDEIEWAEPERQTRAVKEYLAALEAEVEAHPDRKPPKVISPSDSQSAWTAKANKRVQFGYINRTKVTARATAGFGTKRTNRAALVMSVDQRKPEVAVRPSGPFLTQPDMNGAFQCRYLTSTMASRSLGAV